LPGDKVNLLDRGGKGVRFFAYHRDPEKKEEGESVKRKILSMLTMFMLSTAFCFACGSADKDEDKDRDGDRDREESVSDEE